MCCSEKDWLIIIFSRWLIIIITVIIITIIITLIIASERDVYEITSET